MNLAEVGSLTARYEALRRAALGQEPPAGRGLAVVIRQGVSAWMRLLEELDGQPAACGRADPPSRAVKIPELVQTLTNLALGAMRG